MMKHLKSILQLALILLVCTITALTASNALATMQGGTPGVPIVIGEIKYTLDEAGTVPLQDSHIEKGQDFYVDVRDVIDADAIGDPDVSHGAIGTIELYRQVRDVGATEWPEAWGTAVKVDSNPLNYDTNYYRFRVPYHETTIINTTQEVRYKAVAFDGESGSAHDNPKEKVDSEKLVASVDRVVITSTAMGTDGAIYAPVSGDIVLSGEAYDNGEDTQPDTADDVTIDNVSFSWTVNPTLGSFDPTTGNSTTFTAGATTGTCTVTATYDPSGANVSGTATVYVVVIEAEVTEILSKPNNALALNNEFIAQDDTVEVLKTWQNRYKATVQPAGMANVVYKWQRKPHAGGDWQTFIDNATLTDDYTENTGGDFDVRLAVAAGEQIVASINTREVKVCEIEVETFELKQGDPYTKVGDTIVFPATGITMKGEVTETSSFFVERLKWGFIQGIESPNGNYILCEYPLAKNTWTWLPAGEGSHAIYPEKLVARRQMTTMVNDAPLNHYLYGPSTPRLLDTFGEEIDTPGTAPLTRGPLDFRNASGTVTATGVFAFDASTWKYVQNFTVWLVVLNTETDQYVPLKQQNWRLHADAGTGDSWKCEPLGVPADASSTPTDASTSSDSTKTLTEESFQTINHPDTP